MWRQPSIGSPARQRIFGVRHVHNGGSRSRRGPLPLQPTAPPRERQRLIPPA